MHKVRFDAVNNPPTTAGVAHAIRIACMGNSGSMRAQLAAASATANADERTLLSVTISRNSLNVALQGGCVSGFVVEGVKTILKTASTANSAKAK